MHPQSPLADCFAIQGVTPRLIWCFCNVILASRVCGGEFSIDWVILPQEWHAGFMEDCPDGELSKDQFVEMYNKIFPGGCADKFSEIIFRTFDTDRSGTIDFRGWSSKSNWNVTSKCVRVYVGSSRDLVRDRRGEAGLGFQNVRIKNFK